MSLTNTNSDRKVKVVVQGRKMMYRKKRRHSEAFYTFFRAFFITLFLDGIVVIFMLSGMK